MHRVFVNLVLLVGLVMLATGVTTAQSKKKRTGPVVQMGGMKSQTWEHWKPQKKVMKPILYQFVLPRSLKKDEKEFAEVTIKPATATVEELVPKWQQLFEPPKGYTLKEVTRIFNRKAGSSKITTMYIRGTYLKKEKPGDSTSDAKKLPRYVMLSSILETKDKKRFEIQMIGPSRAVGVHQSDYYNFMQSFK